MAEIEDLNYRETCSLCNGKGYCQDYDEAQAKWVKCYDCLGVGAY